MSVYIVRYKTEEGAGQDERDHHQLVLSDDPEPYPHGDQAHAAHSRGQSVNPVDQIKTIDQSHDGDQGNRHTPEIIDLINPQETMSTQGICINKKSELIRIK